MIKLKGVVKSIRLPFFPHCKKRDFYTTLHYTFKNRRLTTVLTHIRRRFARHINLPNSLTTPSPIPFDPPVTIVTFPAYLRFDFSASVAIFSTAAPGRLPKYSNCNVFALNILIKEPSSGNHSGLKKSGSKSSKTRRCSEGPGERRGIFSKGILGYCPSMRNR